MRTNAPLRILIADDYPIVREGLAAVLRRQNMEVVAQAANGQEAVALYRHHQPDITLMDLRMPGMDGLTATRLICTEFPEARIIVLTNSEEEETNSLRAGARTFMLKDAPLEKLFAVMRALQEGD